MARITVPEGDGGELIQVWSLSPELGVAVGNLSAAVYGERLIAPRVREVARMRIAQINGCNVCLAWRFPEMAERGVTEDLYAHVDDPASGDYSEQELLAIESAERFALDHRSIDDAERSRRRGRPGDDAGCSRRAARRRRPQRAARPARGEPERGRSGERRGRGQPEPG
jgi:alkylhydroperoxidase family enzyme